MEEFPPKQKATGAPRPSTPHCNFPIQTPHAENYPIGA
jgi:hypothetical protein